MDPFYQLPTFYEYLANYIYFPVLTETLFFPKFISLAKLICIVCFYNFYNTTAPVPIVVFYEEFTILYYVHRRLGYPPFSIRETSEFSRFQ